MTPMIIASYCSTRPASSEARSFTRPAFSPTQAPAALTRLGETPSRPIISFRVVRSSSISSAIEFTSFASSSLAALSAIRRQSSPPPAAPAKWSLR